MVVVQQGETLSTGSKRRERKNYNRHGADSFLLKRQLEPKKLFLRKYFLAFDVFNAIFIDEKLKKENL